MDHGFVIGCLLSACLLGCSSTVSGGNNNHGGAGSGSGGDAGSSAAAGTGGSGGSAGSPVQACTADADCDDGNRCNGTETCSAGKCVAGSIDPACSGMDATNCDCISQGGKCVILGRDGDHDNHRNAACKADVAADDCNDACATCYPGAKEVCDGLDNDCNGRADVFDTLELYGQPDALLATSTEARVVWWPSQNVYAVMAQDTGSNPRLVLFLIGVDGTKRVGPVDITADTTAIAVGQLYASGDQLGILLSPGAGGPPMLVRYDVKGTLLGKTPIAPQNLDPGTTAFFGGTIIAAPGGGWHTLYTRFQSSSQTAYLVRFDQSGAQTGEDFFGAGAKARSAFSGNTVLISDYDSDSSVSVLATIGSVGAVLDTRGDLGEINAMGDATDVFGVQSTSSGNPVFNEVKPNMDTSCGPINVDANISDHRLSSTGAYWVGFTSPGNVPTLQVVKAGCGATKGLPLATQSIYNGAFGSVAASDKGALLVWRTPAETLAFRAVGPLLCDAPRN